MFFSDEMPYEQVFNPVQFLLKVFFWFVDFLWIFFPFHQTEVALKQFHDESLENRENFPFSENSLSVSLSICLYVSVLYMPQIVIEKTCLHFLSSVCPLLLQPCLLL